jgi:riboflavin kinase/FMN adenylyltransferase
MPRFNAVFASLSAEAFLDDVLKRTLSVRAVVVGDNFAFGKNRGGDVAMLRAWGAANSIEVVVVPPVMVDGAPCSSSAIRAAIGAGDMKMAASLLGRPYQFTGRVMHGDGRGHTIGFATANLALPQRLKLPSYGVYAVRATVHGTTHDAVANVGVRPTVANVARPSLEVHLFDFNQTIYGASMQVQFIEKIRDEKKFHSLDALTGQIADDCVNAKTILAHNPE